MMRKLIWYCSAVGVLTAGGFLSLTYYACRYPDSLLGRCLYTITEASLTMQPLNGLASRAMRSSGSHPRPHIAEVSIPDDPKPIVPSHEEEADAAPIIIPEDDPMPPTVGMAVTGGMMEQEMPAKGCRLVMPYAEDSDAKPNRPAEKTAGDSSEEAERAAFKEWMQLLESTEKSEPAAAEELPPPTEEESGIAPKCQEDSHRHEQYPGCPHTTCPRGGKSLRSDVPANKWKGGHEESSEEPPTPHDKKSSHGKKPKDKDERPRTQGVDTMEYRPSDGGLNENDYGPFRY